MQDPRTIVITGGSSGIGAALARSYARPGRFLALTGREPERLQRVAEECRTAGATVEATVLDVCDREVLETWLTAIDRDHPLDLVIAIDRDHPLDLVIANAGVSAGTGSFGENAEQTRHILAVNVDGVVTTVLAATALMRPKRHGQVAIMSSLAAFRGFPGAPAYCASKAAVRVWGEALRGMVAKDGLTVSVICPGYVKSRMTAVNDFPMPFLMESDKAARIIQRGLATGKARIVFPRRLFACVWLLALLPPAWTDPLLKRLPEKPADHR